MYASVIGKKLLEQINKESNQNKTPKEFFDEVYFTTFYDHPKYLFWAINSPFVQGYKSNDPPNKERRQKNLKELHNKIENNIPDGSFAIGFGALDDTATTSGQITSLNLPITKDDIYYSWIGSGLGIGMSGGFVLLINNYEVLKILYDGWFRYRQLVNETEELKGNQIETWNGQWLTFALSDPNYKNKIFNPLVVKNNEVRIPTQSWIKVLFALTKKYPNQKINSYVYKLNKTNTTIGFIQINLPEINREIEMYNYLFGNFNPSLKRAIEDVYTTEHTFGVICQNGVIGLKEIEPKGIKEYLPRKNKESKEIKFKNDEKSLINYNIYLSWVITMLNNKSLIQKAEDFANELVAIKSDPKRAKKTDSNLVDSLLSSVSRKAFITNITPLMSSDNFEFINSLVIDIDQMQSDKFPYFMSLLNFKYTYFKNKNHNGETK